MRYTRVLGKTLRDVPQSIRMPSYALLHRGGYIRQMAQGLFSFLPLGMRVLQNIRRIIAEEMGALGGQEIYVPVVTPSDIWRRSGSGRTTTSGVSSGLPLLHPFGYI